MSCIYKGMPGVIGNTTLLKVVNSEENVQFVSNFYIFEKPPAMAAFLRLL